MPRKKKTPKPDNEVEFEGIEPDIVEDDEKDASTPKALIPLGCDDRAVTPVDPLHAYLREIQQYPLLTLDEEKSLIRRYREEGDVEAARKLVASHLRLVAKIAFQYRNAYYNLLDIIQEGNVGLMVAVKKFDPDKQTRFGYYATWWIKSYILKYILDNFRLIKIGTTRTQRRLFYHLIQEKQKIESMGYVADTQRLAASLDATEAEIDEMSRRLSQSERSLNAPISAGEPQGSTLEEFIADDDVPLDEKVAQQEIKDIFGTKLGEFVKSLKPREATIFQERLLAEVPRTLQDIADEYSISKERARQIESRLFEKLKAYFAKFGLEPPV